MKILLGYFNVKVGRENTFKQAVGNESLHQDINDNDGRILNIITSKNLVHKNMMFSLRNFQKNIWTSPDGKTHSQSDQILIDRRLQFEYTRCTILEGK